MSIVSILICIVNIIVIIVIIMDFQLDLYPPKKISSHPTSRSPQPFPRGGRAAGGGPRAPADAGETGPRLPLLLLPEPRAGEVPARLRRRKLGQIYLYRRNFIRGFYGASEIFLTPRETTV